MTKVQVHVNPNAKGFEVSPELAALLGAKDGDSIYLTEAAVGHWLTQFDPERLKTLKLTEDFVSRYADALTELAK